jgi:hypothetical protein
VLDIAEGMVKGPEMPCQRGVGITIKRGSHFIRYRGDRDILTKKFVVLILKVMHDDLYL